MMGLRCVSRADAKETEKEVGEEKKGQEEQAKDGEPDEKRDGSVRCV